MQAAFGSIVFVAGPFSVVDDLQDFQYLLDGSPYLGKVRRRRPITICFYDGTRLVEGEGVLSKLCGSGVCAADPPLLSRPADMLALSR
jgi:hypothetical protein